jgi:hypothetical protein
MHFDGYIFHFQILFSFVFVKINYAFLKAYKS